MENTRSDKSGLLDSLAQMIGQAERFLNKAGEAGGREYDSALNKAAEKLRSAQAEFVHVEEAAMKRAKQAALATDNAVHAHPYTSIGVAAAVGVLIGVLLSRR